MRLSSVKGTIGSILISFNNYHVFSWLSVYRDGVRLENEQAQADQPRCLLKEHRLFLLGGPQEPTPPPWTSTSESLVTGTGLGQLLLRGVLKQPGRTSEQAASASPPEKQATCFSMRA